MNQIKIIKNYYQTQQQIANDINLSNTIIQKVQSLNFKGSSYLGFDDITLNFTINGYERIIQFCNLLYEKQINLLIIWTKPEIQKAIEASINFVLGLNDFDKSKKIRLVFVNESQNDLLINRQITKELNENNKETVGLLFLDSFGAEKAHLNSIKNFLSQFNRYASDFLIKKSIFYVGRSISYVDTLNLNVPRENCLFVSDDVHPQYSLLSEIGLVILALQGINVQKVIEGYAKASESLSEFDIYFNKALDLALILNNNFKNNEDSTFMNHLIAYDTSLNNFLGYFAYLFNKTTLAQNILNTNCSFPKQINTYAQNLLSGPIYTLASFWVVKNKSFDFQLSSNIENDDLIDQIKNYTVNQIKNSSYETFSTYLNSFNDTLNSFTVEINSNSEFALGQLINLLYWSRIYYCVINDIDPFA
ncbi:hypothetical protein [Mycoplasma nasistruthionis]|uniref:Glucose-6-phosphate isomerase n=1 Tax=Mycoplasma nasistruthionis TaxID=353852 RepID=A0A5B7XUM5_9MOLU|nr:hypothetical protein [Mycoplasma nasistruthionis]QCZ36591.1 hypothetical protein FG904_00980 [Mycoplasma nasistruthionis]